MPVDEIATDRMFYYQVSSPTRNTSNLVSFVSENLNNKRVTITHQSGQDWPFYYVLDEREELPYDSLMPPHFYIHLLKKKKDEKILPGEFYVDIKIMPVADTLPNFQLHIYQMDSAGLGLTAVPRIHYLEPTQAQDSVKIYDTMLKSIIRYSFK